MSISQPSKQVYIVEVPNCKNFEADFTYNYFEPQESVSEFAGIPLKFRSKPAEFRDTSLRQFASTRVPRWVALSWTLPRLKVRGLFALDSQQRGDQFDVAPNYGVIRNNLDKIMTEDAFASDGFATLSFQDAKMNEKMFFAASGSYVQHTIDEPNDKADNHYRAALRAEAIAPDDVNPEFINRALTQPLLAHGVQQHRSVNWRKPWLIDKLTDKLNKVSIGAQVNTRVLSSIVEQSSDQMSNEPDDFDAVKEMAEALETNQQNAGQDDVDDEDFKLYLPYINGRVDTSGNSRIPKQYAKLIGFIVDKREILSDGTTVEKSPIIIENPRIKETLDFAIKYNAQYVYQVRAIYKLTAPAIDEETGDIAILEILVSSSPTQQEFVSTIERISPPPPTDVNFVWDYRRLNRDERPGSLMIHWTFPPNPQRDIKRFQVYRRKSVEHAFELVKMYDFDDSAIPQPFREEYDPSVTEEITSPATWWFDDDFTKSSRFIYSLCSIDAHGYVSDYGAQFEIWFDIFENRIKKRLISHTGAPRPYPNLYLEKDLFVDTIKVNGDKSKTMRLYFNPEYYRVFDDEDKNIPVIATEQKGGKYRIQFINADNQKDQVITIKIDDIVGKTKERYQLQTDENSLEMENNTSVSGPGRGRTRRSR